MAATGPILVLEYTTSTMNAAGKELSSTVQFTGFTDCCDYACSMREYLDGAFDRI